MSGDTRLGNVMLIDDEGIDRRIYERMIERSGLDAEVFSFAYAEDALAFLGRHDAPEIDLILLDINMPRMNGFEFLETAVAMHGAHFAKVVVVMLTTSLNPCDRERAGHFEVVKDFINKPLTQRTLHDIAALLAASGGAEDASNAA